jgi:hypothetical protein
MINKLISIVFFVGIMVCTWLMLKITIPYFTFDYDVDFLLTKQAILHSDIWRWSFYIHISTSLVVLFLGVFQFVKLILNKFPKFHRNLGKIYILSILILSAPSGLVMAFYANGGIWAKLSFLILSLLWWIFTCIAYLKIVKGEIQSHIAFMIRSYGLTLSALTLRTYVVALPLFLHLHGKEMYVLVAWLSWIPNLIISEFLIKRKVFK